MSTGGTTQLASLTQRFMMNNANGVRSWPEMARDPERGLERLLVIEPRIDAALVRALEIRLGQPARATNALGDVFTGELDVHAAESRAELLMQLEALLELADDPVETPGLDALRCR